MKLKVHNGLNDQGSLITEAQKVKLYKLRVTNLNLEPINTQHMLKLKLALQ
jgi:hypothetical protein